MEKLKLIGEQQLEIKRLRLREKDLRRRLDNIYKMLVCVGGPLNGDISRFSKQDIKMFFDMRDEVEYPNK